MGFGEQVILHSFQWSADAIFQLVAGVDQVLNRLLGAVVSALCGMDRGVAMAECRWKTLEHDAVGKAQNTSLSLVYDGYVTA